MHASPLTATLSQSQRLREDPSVARQRDRRGRERAAGGCEAAHPGSATKEAWTFAMRVLHALPDSASALGMRFVPVLTNSASRR